MRRLTIDEVLQLAAGCESCIADGDAIRFMRLPGSLADHYRQVESRRIRMECPAGVRLRLRSNTRMLRIAVRYGESSRPFYRGSILRDGKFLAPFGSDSPSVEGWQGVVNLPALPDPKSVAEEIEVWLPHQVGTALVSIEVDDTAAVRRGCDQSRRWLALGDSITQGMVAPLPHQAWTSVVACELNLDLRNFGIGGAQLESALCEAAMPWPYDVMTIAFGANDFNHSVPPDQYAENAAKLLARQSRDHPNARFLLMTPTPWLGRTTNEAGCTLADYRAVLADVVAGCPRCTLILGTELMPDDPGLFCDGLHPNAQGMSVLAHSLAPLMRKAMEIADRPNS